MVEIFTFSQIKTEMLIKMYHWQELQTFFWLKGNSVRTGAIKKKMLLYYLLFPHSVQSQAG